MSMSEEAQLVATRHEYTAILVSTFGFGVYIILACLSLHFLLRGPDVHRTSSRGRRVVLGYTWCMLLVTIAWYSYTARNFEFTLVEQRYAPPGQDGQRFWRPQNIVQNVLATLQFLGSDALILYRTYIVCDRRWALLLLPTGIYISFIGVAITINLVSLSTQFGGPLALPPVHRLATAFYVLCASQNLVCLGLISARLVHTARASMSKTTVTILAESAAAYTLCSIVFVILFQTNSPAQTWFGAVANCSSFLCQAWIILRVAMHQAYTTRSASTAPRAEFTTDIRLPSRMSMHSVYNPNDSLTLDGASESKQES